MERRSLSLVPATRVRIMLASPRSKDDVVVVVITRDENARRARARKLLLSTVRAFYRDPLCCLQLVYALCESSF